ncbi:hypothetical protein SKAU_G00180200 [Synaphobranchus kaupii]|uniref:Uncharacterized protein n=1 Tax=Synaphobranchus kaupii TaxID=118154 RepID=A0A9Q1FM67_SYNKA|nr:hypothetical protein SKAU_G00180200 [Synaphobranchus kaupii]
MKSASQTALEPPPPPIPWMALGGLSACLSLLIIRLWPAGVLLTLGTSMPFTPCLMALGVTVEAWTGSLSRTHPLPPARAEYVDLLHPQDYT